MATGYCRRAPVELFAQQTAKTDNVNGFHDVVMFTVFTSLADASDRIQHRQADRRRNEKQRER